MHPARPLTRARDIARILAERARALATVDEEAPLGTRTLVAFTMGGCALAVPVETLSRAIDLGVVTEIPGGPEYLLGIIVVDNKLVSLLDVPAFLGLSRRGVGDVTSALVVQDGGRRIALAAEELIRIGDGGGDDDVRVLDVAALFGDARLAGRSR